jgi:hypothetical protein
MVGVTCQQGMLTPPQACDPTSDIIIYQSLFYYLLIYLVIKIYWLHGLWPVSRGCLLLQSSFITPFHYTNGTPFMFIGNTDWWGWV